MMSRDMAKTVRRIEIKSKIVAEELFSGEYRSSFRGKGMDFDSIRQYVPGDDVRSIDWNVTARQSRTYVKQFSEERELNMYLLIDMSRSNSFGSKKTAIAELGATLAFTASRNNDKVGALFFTDKVEKLIPSKNGRKHILSIIEHMLGFEPASGGTSVAAALEYLNRIEKKRSVIFVISDFLDEGFARIANMMSGRHDLVLLRVIDRAEEALPSGAVFTFEDLETGETVVLDNTRKEYGPNGMPPLTGRNVVNIYTDEDIVKPLEYFFRRRMRG